MEWSPPPRSSSSPGQASIRDSISLQVASSASSSISTSATNNSTAATSSMSITPDREAGGVTDAIASKIVHGGESAAESGGGSAQAGTDVDASTEATTDNDEGEVKEEEEGEGHEGGREASHAEKASGQTRATRKSWYRTVIPETPTTHPEEGRAATPAPTPLVRRSLRSAAKSTSEASGRNRKGVRGARDMTRRQSKRLMEATKLATSTTPAPTRGKRSHEAMAVGSKSANAKLQNSTPTTTTASTGHSNDGQTPLRFSKRTKKVLSYNEDDHDEQFVLSLARSASDVTSKLQGWKRKSWLNQGLYLGQEQDIDVTKRPVGGLTRTRRGKTTEQTRRPVLPLPMFTGLRIMNTERDFKLPFNIYAPSPWKCGPIQDWRKLNHNVLIGDAAAHWKKEKASTAKCVCTDDQGCDEDCLNACTWVECDDGNCNVGAERCKNRAFADLKERVRIGTKFAEGVEVVKTANCGHGLRATRSFEPNQIIVEYTGEIITQEESERRMVEVYKDNKNYYLMLFHQNMILDATRGSVARFVNHSCNPNCTMEKWLVEGRPRMALFAGDGGVEAGMELTYDYNFNWFTGVSQQTCHCGAKNCRGALGKKADGFQGKSSPSVKGKGKESNARSSARSTKSSNKSGRVVSKGDSGKGNLKKPAPVARNQKPKVLGLSRRTRTRRKPPPPPPQELSSGSEEEVVLVATPGAHKGVEHDLASAERELENDVDSGVEGGVEHEVERGTKQEMAQGDDQSVGESSSSRPKSAPNLTNFGGSPRLRGGRLRHLKTYKINKTIRERTPGSRLTRSIASQDALRRATRKMLDQIVLDADRPITVAAPGSVAGAGSTISASDRADTDSARVDSRGTSASSAVGLRRSARRSVNPSAASNAADTAAPLLGQALATALVTGAEVDGVITPATGMKMPSSIPVTA